MSDCPSGLNPEDCDYLQLGLSSCDYCKERIDAELAAARRSGRAEAFKEIADAMLKRGAIEATAGHRVAAGVLTEMAEALLARAEEVERE